jgi:hypothetical protein
MTVLIRTASKQSIDITTAVDAFPGSDFPVGLDLPEVSGLPAS